MGAPPPIDDIDIRAYFAAIVGAVRAPFGKRGASKISVGKSAVLARNTTSNRVIDVTVSRSDVTSVNTAIVIFSQQDDGAGSSNDFTVNFVAAGLQRFVLKPGDVLTASVTAAVGPQTTFPFVVGQETF